MNWITGIETAVEYIENNLLRKLDYEDIAACAYCSSHHFQRMFSVFSGYTLGEYIRARRMTLAGAELKGSDTKILDLAIKYGYENPESFTRAFTRFHGITPSDAKKENAKITAYTRFVNYEYAIGGNLLSYTVVIKKNGDSAPFRKMFDYAGYELRCTEKLPDGVYAAFDCLSEKTCKRLFDQIIKEWLPSTGFSICEKSVYIISKKMFIPIKWGDVK